MTRALFVSNGHGEDVIGLPGTRADAHVSFPAMLEAMRRPPMRHAELLVAWAAPEHPVAPAGWEAEATGRDRGVVLRFRHREGTVVHLTRGAFATLVRGARIALSTSGTAADERIVGHMMSDLATRAAPRSQG